MIRGQVVLREMGIGGIPIINTENACASSSTAFHIAWMYVASGMYDIALAVGMEKLYHEDKRRSFQAIGAAVDVEWVQQMQAAAKAQEQKQKADNPGVAEGAGEKRSMFMDFYAAFARSHMAKYGTTKEQFARIAVKNHYHGSLNPHAQYREVYSLEDVLADRGRGRGDGDLLRGDGQAVHDEAGLRAGVGPRLRFRPRARRPGRHADGSA